MVPAFADFSGGVAASVAPTTFTGEKCQEPQT